MPTGRATHLTVRLTPAERRTLEAWQRSLTLTAGQVRRGRILLLLAEGRSISSVADTVGISRRFVYKWARRFQAQGLQGLHDLPRPDRRQTTVAGEDTP
jgi:Helix-turn-helix domain